MTPTNLDAHLTTPLPSTPGKGTTTLVEIKKNNPNHLSLLDDDPDSPKTTARRKENTPPPTPLKGFKKQSLGFQHTDFTTVLAQAVAMKRQMNTCREGLRPLAIHNAVLMDALSMITTPIAEATASTFPEPMSPTK